MAAASPTVPRRAPRLDLKNDRYVILLKFRSGTERYYRGKTKWVKETLRGRKMPATAEQVLNHLLPALAGVKPGIGVEVKYRRPRARVKRPV
jgi:hypothetical protein